MVKRKKSKPKRGMSVGTVFANGSTPRETQSFKKKATNWQESF
jgi:hypothetical protein